MIQLRKMYDAEYPAYCDYFIADYSQEIVANYGHSQDVAVELAKQDLQDAFGQGLTDTPHQLLCIEKQHHSKRILLGYLWHRIDIKAQSSFIYDFYIAPVYRGHGHGKQTIEQLQNRLSEAGIKQIKCRVAYQNKRALALYQAVGFTISGYNMTKTLSLSD